MVCSNCGQNIPNGAKFCGNCGTKVPEKQFCTSCGAERNGERLFCSVCGMRFDSRTTPNDSISAIPKGQLLMTLNLYSLYEGEPTLGYAKSSGQLSVYDDRLEFKKQLGHALASSLGLVGTLVARNSAKKKNPVEVYRLEEISAYKVGKYGGIYNTLVLIFKNGRIISLCPPIPGSADPQKIIDRLQPYM